MSYPDTTVSGSSTARVIPNGSSSFTIQITFGEPVTGFEAADIALTGASISGFTSNSEGTAYTIDVDVDMTAQPSVISFEFIGTIDAAFGNTWSPQLSGSFTYDDLFPSATVTYPDTTYDAGEAAQIIPIGSNSFEVQIEFSQAISGLEASDITLSSGTVTSVTSNTQGTIWTVIVEADLTVQPSDLDFEITGYVETTQGLIWMPSVEETFTYTGLDTAKAVTITYPDTTAGTSAQIIPAGSESFQVSIEFTEAVTGFDDTDISVTGGTVSSVTSTLGGTVWIVTVDVDLTAQPSDITVEVIGDVETSWGLVWTPDVDTTFSYPDTGFTFSERQNDTDDDWGASRTTSATHSAVVYSTDYANLLANGVLAGAVDLDTTAMTTSTNMELVETGKPGGVSSYRGVVQIGDEVYSAELHVTASGAHSLRIFDPVDVVLTKGPAYTGSLTGSYTYTGVLAATEYGNNATTYLEGDFVLTANFATDSFTMSSGAITSDHLSITGIGILDSATGIIASDTLVLNVGDHTDPDSLDHNSIVTFGNIHGDGTDVTGVFYTNDGTSLTYTTGEGQTVGTLVGSQ